MAEIYVERLPLRARLGRHVRHDERSRGFAYDEKRLTLRTSTQHHSGIGIMDQGQLGACTGFASTKCVTYAPFWEGLAGQMIRKGHPAKNRAYATGVYSDAEILDGGVGLPDEDQGSSGLSVAKVLSRRGLIGTYQHAFDVGSALDALVRQPVIIGVNWYEGMFYPDREGFVSPSGPLAGGHELCVDQINVEGRFVGGPNSWGTSWGLKGRFKMSWDVLERLLGERGDVTVFRPHGM